jgi:rhodanese-related sulfurtransferase
MLQLCYYPAVLTRISVDGLPENPRSKIIPIILFLIVAVPIIYTQLWKASPSSGYGDVTVEQAHELVEGDRPPVVLDVRNDWEFDDGHLEGAINIPVDDLEGRLGELDKEDEILVYCRTGNRSARAVQILSENGFEKMYHMVDGIEGWKAAGYPTVK